MSDSGAAPAYWFGQTVPAPAASPATIVPCPNWSPRASGSSDERLTCFTTRPPKSSFVRSMPESMIAIVGVFLAPAPLQSCVDTGCLCPEIRISRVRCGSDHARVTRDRLHIRALGQRQEAAAGHSYRRARDDPEPLSNRSLGLDGSLECTLRARALDDDAELGAGMRSGCSTQGRVDKRHNSALNARRFASLSARLAGAGELVGLFSAVAATGTAVSAMRAMRMLAKPRPPLPQSALERESPPEPLPQRALDRIWFFSESGLCRKR